MSIEIKIHEPPVTFGMLPVGTVFKTSVFPKECIGFKHAPSSYASTNATDADGGGMRLTDECPVEVIHLPPGAELARPKAKLVRAMETKVGDVVQLNGSVLCMGGGTPSSTMQYVWNVATKAREAISNAQMVQPCRVEVHVYPEYEQ